MKKLVIAVALIVASAAPVMAEGFPNPYMHQPLIPASLTEHLKEISP